MQMTDLITNQNKMLEITLSNKKKAFIKEELTAGEYDLVKEVYMDYIISQKDEKSTYTASIMTAAKYRLLSVITDRIEIGKETIKPVNEEYLKSMNISDIEKLEQEANKVKGNSIIGETTKKK